MPRWTLVFCLIACTAPEDDAGRETPVDTVDTVVTTTSTTSTTSTTTSTTPTTSTTTSTTAPTTGTGSTTVPVAPEDCDVPGDEDGDGDADCIDADCALVCDADEDGFVDQDRGGDDCDDVNAAVHPGAPEVCGAADDDCDGLVDDADAVVDAPSWFVDADLDTYGDPARARVQCTPPAGSVATGDDCDDADAGVNPGAAEVCFGVDEDCDVLEGDADPSVDLASATTWYEDLDGDGYGDDLSQLVACLPPAGHVEAGGDCDDADPSAHEEVAWVPDADLDGFGSGVATAPSCHPPSSAYAPESAGVDCADGDATRYPGAVDACGDGVDQDCDTLDCVACTEIVVAVLPGWGGATNASLVWNSLVADASAYGACPIRAVDVYGGFDLAELVATGATVLWVGDPSGVALNYTAAEIAAIDDFVYGGYGGFVATFLLSDTSAIGAVYDNTELFAYAGVDPASVASSDVVALTLVDVLEPAHPVVAGLPNPFTSASFTGAQAASVPWDQALLPDTSILAISADGNNVVVAHDGAWRGVYVSTYAEYLAGDEAARLVYNSARWAGGYD